MRTMSTFSDKKPYFNQNFCPTYSEGNLQHNNLNQKDERQYKSVEELKN